MNLIPRGLFALGVISDSTWLGPLAVNMPEVGVAECESATWFLMLVTPFGPIGCVFKMAIGGLLEGPKPILGPVLRGSYSVTFFDGA